MNGIEQECVLDPMTSAHGVQLLQMYTLAGLDVHVDKNLDEQNVFDMIMACYNQKLFDIDTMIMMEELLDNTGLTT